MLKETDIQYLLFFYNNAMVTISEHYELEKRFEREFRTKVSPSFKVDMGDRSPVSSSRSNKSPTSNSYKSPASSKNYSSSQEDDTVRDMPIIPEEDINKVKKYYENLSKDIPELTLGDVIQRLKILGSLSNDDDD